MREKNWGWLQGILPGQHDRIAIYWNRGNQEFILDIKLKPPVRHSITDSKLKVRYLDLQFKEEVQAGHINLRVIIK